MLQGTNARILETRKTVPGMRLPDKWAVLIGGGVNHRGARYMVMIKDNHVTAAGGVEPAVKRAQVLLICIGVLTAVLCFEYALVAQRVTHKLGWQ